MLNIKKKILKEGEIIPLTFDAMFTEVFNNEENICILEEFIAFYLELPLKKVRDNLKLLSRNLKRENLKESRKEVDLLLDLNDKKINIELSNGWNEEVRDRNVVFLSNVHGTQLKRGFKSYKEIEETIQINLNNFNEQKELVTTYYLKNEEGEIFSKKLRIDSINLEKGKKMIYTNNERENMLIDWCKVLTSRTKKEMEEALKKILSKKSINKLTENVKRLSGDEDMVDLYGYQEKRKLEEESRMRLGKEKARKEGFNDGYNDGFNKGVNEGISQGISQEKTEIAKNLLKNNIDINVIISSTGLSEEEILKLK